MFFLQFKQDLSLSGSDRNLGAEVSVHLGLVEMGLYYCDVSVGKDILF